MILPLPFQAGAASCTQCSGKRIHGTLKDHSIEQPGLWYDAWVGLRPHRVLWAYGLNPKAWGRPWSIWSLESDIIYLFGKGFLRLQHGEEIRRGQQWTLGEREKVIRGHWSFPIFCGLVLHKESPDGKEWEALRTWDQTPTLNGELEMVSGKEPQWNWRHSVECGVTEAEKGMVYPVLLGGQIIKITTTAFVATIYCMIIMCLVPYKFNLI